MGALRNLQPEVALYTPKKGSSSAHTKADNAFMTNKMLTELQSLDFEIDRQRTQSNTESTDKDLVTPQAQVNNMNLANEMDEHLTQDEKEQLTRLLRERRQVEVAAAPVPTEDLATAYEGEMN